MPVGTVVCRSCQRGILLAAMTVALAGCGGGEGGSSAAPEPLAPAAALPDTAGVSFSARSVDVSESARHVAVGITRTGQGRGATSIGYRLRGIGASLPADASPAEGRLDWADGETGERTVDLLVHSDDLLESTETLELVLEAIEGDRPVTPSLTISILDAPCDATLPARIDRDASLEGACYRLHADMEVAAGARLELGAGSTIIAAAGTRLTVTDSATLIATGDTLRPVRLVGANHEPGYWQGLRIDSSSALQQLGSTHVADAVIGVEVLPGSSLARFDAGSIDNTSVAALRLPLVQADRLDTSARFTRSGGGVQLTGTSMRREDFAHLPRVDTFYTMQDDLLVAGRLTLDAGVDLRFARNRRAFVAGSGSIQAIGTADAPISIGAIEAVQGAWRGLQLNGSAADNRLEHITIRHGGGDAARDGNLSISGKDTRLSVTSVTFEDSAGVGLWLDGPQPLVSIEAPRFKNNRLGQTRRGAEIEDFDTL